MRVLGPLRNATQVEISVADGFALGTKAPVRMSGDLLDSPGIEIIGPKGRVVKHNGMIVAAPYPYLARRSRTARPA